MKRLFKILLCVAKSEKIFSVEKKKFVIFDCVNSDILSKLLPKNQTHIISARVYLIKKILINFKTISFILKNFFKRKPQLNYFISLINQIQPKFVLTTIDNSFNFSILSKYFDGKTTFVAIQNATRGDIYRNVNKTNKLLYFSNYMGFSEFDLEVMKNNNIKIKNFFSFGSLRNSYYSKYLHKDDNEKKNYDICVVCKRTFRNGAKSSSEAAKDSIIVLKFLAKYSTKHNKKIVIQSKSQFNSAENSFISKLFAEVDYKISWRDLQSFSSYRAISSSKLVIGPPSSLLREASFYPNTKILCFNTEKKFMSLPFEGLNILEENSYEKFEERINQILQFNYEEYIKKINKKHEYFMQKKNRLNFLLEFLEIK